MSIYLEAADAVEREAARAESLAKVAADLRRVGSLQQAGDEARNRLDALTARIGDLNQLDVDAQVKAEAIVDAAKEEAKRIKASAAETETQLINNAQATVAQAALVAEEAGQKVAAAQRTGDDIVSQAEARATEIIADATRQADELAPAIEAVSAKRAELAAAQERLDAITTQIEALKAKF